MKKLVVSVVLSAACLFISVSAKAQNHSWVSEKGYWVVESNKHTPKDAIVYFYTNDDRLVYKEEIRNQKLKLNKKKTLYRLKAALEEAIGNSDKGTWAGNKQLVAYHLQQ